MKYNDFVKNEINNSTDIWLTAWPITGWLTSMYIFGFHYPVKYFIKSMRGFDEM